MKPLMRFVAIILFAAITAAACARAEQPATSNEFTPIPVPKARSLETKTATVATGRDTLGTIMWV